MSLERIMEEFTDINNNPIGNCGVTVGLENDNYREWIASILGPKDTSYRGGVFFFSAKFPYNFPEKPPEVCFVTPIYHVNVNPKAPKIVSEGIESLGHVCLSTLNWWKPEYRMREVFTNIFALFYLANPDSPYGLDRADEFRYNRTVYEDKIKYFTRKYANPLENHNKKYDRNKDWDFSYN